MIRIQQLKLPLEHTKKDLEKKIRKELRLKAEDNFRFRIWKQSLDARRSQLFYVYTIDVFIEKEFRVLKKVSSKNIMSTKEKSYHFSVSGEKKLLHPPVIIGAGPAGLFCAYQLAKNGYCPIILERGKKVKDRQKDVELFWETGILDPRSNVQFGEGGAGTFSDGKLNTLVKDPVGRNRYVLETFVNCGSDASILYVNKPHIGTDVLTEVVTALRQEILRLGGRFCFEACLTDLYLEEGRVIGLEYEQKGLSKRLSADQLVLAIGHSARDTFEMLYQKQVPMEAKSFAVGFRAEHPQKMINELQYKGAADFKALPPASYKVTANFKDQRGVYSFCMCPGGYVVNASSERKRLAVNGMSYHKRDGQNANSAIIVSVTPGDFPDQTPLGGLAFQRQLETRAYELGDGKIPQQLLGDYAAGKITTAYGDFPSQTRGSSCFADLNELLPGQLKSPFIEGMKVFGKKLPGFDRYDTILSGIESRTSSPVRILRDEGCESLVKGIYPCGEGAGYAGGIMSAAMDGLKVAEALAAVYRPLEAGNK